MRLIYFVIGAAVGTGLRFLIVNHLKSWTEFPAGVLTVNVLGSFILGLTAFGVALAVLAALTVFCCGFVCLDDLGFGVFCFELYDTYSGVLDAVLSL